MNPIESFPSPLTPCRRVADSESSMPTKRGASIGLLLICGFLFLACAPSSRACSSELKVDDPQLSAAIQASLAARSKTVAVTGQEAADYTGYAEKALRKTFDEDIVATATRQTCSTYRNGENEFAILALTYADPATAERIATSIRARKANTLKVESLMYYAFLPSGATLLFFIADRQSYTEERDVFDEIERTYRAK